MNTLRERLDALNALVARFDYETAHDRFYHRDLIKHENEQAPTIGLAAHRAEMQLFLAKIENARAECLQTTVLDQHTATLWQYTFDHADWGSRSFKQLSVQHWKDDRIIHERHHYAMGG